MQDLHDRLVALERQARRSRHLNLALGVALLSLACLSAAPRDVVHEVVRTRSLEVLNEDGSVVVMAGAGRDGHGWLSIRSAEERLAFLAQGWDRADGGPGRLRVYGAVRVMSTDEQALVETRPAASGAGELTLRDRTGARVVSLGADAGGAGEVGAWAPEGGGRTFTARD